MISTGLQRVMLIVGVAASLLIGAAGDAAGAKVEITTDVDIVVYIDGVQAAQVAAEDTTALTVNDRPHELWIIAAAAPGVGERHLLELASGKTEEIEVELARDAEDWLSSDEDDREPAPWESPLANRSDGILADPENGLEWVWVDNGRNVDWDSAKAFCERLDVAGRGWRLPTMDELETLVGRDSRFGFKIVEPLWLTACCVWSSEEHGSISAWYMGFDAGERGFVTRDYQDDARALCVRGEGGE